MSANNDADDEEECEAILNDPDYFLDDFFGAFVNEIDLKAEREKLRKPDDAKWCLHLDRERRRLFAQIRKAKRQCKRTFGLDLKTLHLTTTDLKKLLLGYNVYEYKSGDNEIDMTEPPDSSDDPDHFENLQRHLGRFHVRFSGELNKFSSLLFCHSQDDVNASSKQVISLHANTFQGLTHLKRICLNKNQIELLHPETFQGLVHLEVLEMWQNRLGLLHKDTFRGLVSLQTLLLSSNRIRSLVEPELFADLVALEVLELSENGLAEVADGLFVSLKSLETLQLDRNELTCIGQVQWPESMCELNVGSNKLEKVSSSLRALGKLQTLHLSNNQLTRLERDTWPESLEHLIVSVASHVEFIDSFPSNLKDLFIGNSDLAWLCRSDKTFADLTQLTTLVLSNNGIADVHPDCFRDLTSLAKLYLDANKIEALSAQGVFRHLHKLRFLTLEANKMQRIDANTFRGLDSLEILILSGQQLTDLAFGEKNLANLKSLYLHRNKLSTLKSGVFSQMSNLTDLQLEGNDLSSLELGALRGLESNLELLYLNENPKLTSLDVRVFQNMKKRQQQQQLTVHLDREIANLRELRNIYSHITFSVFV